MGRPHIAVDGLREEIGRTIQHSQQWRHVHGQLQHGTGHHVQRQALQQLRANGENAWQIGQIESLDPTVDETQTSGLTQVEYR